MKLDNFQTAVDIETMPHDHASESQYPINVPRTGPASGLDALAHTRRMPNPLGASMTAASGAFRRADTGTLEPNDDKFAVRFYENPTRNPTVPRKGSRPTFFTTLSTMSFKSIRSLDRKPRADQDFAVRVDPPRLVIRDYMPGAEYTRAVSIKNFTKTIQHISLSTTQTKLFQLVRGIPMDDILISPGLHKEIKIVFRAPQLVPNAPAIVSQVDPTTHERLEPQDPAKKLAESSGSGKDPSFRLYMDRITVLVRGGPSILVPLEAYPAGPTLEFDDRVDFGTLIVSRNSAAGANSGRKHLESSVNKSAKAASSAQNDSRGWKTHYVEIRNTGMRSTTFKCTYDRSLPLRVTPQTVMLEYQSKSNMDPADASCSCMLKIEFLPRSIGKFEADVHLVLIDEPPKVRSQESSNHRSDMCLHVSANVIEHKIRLRSALGSYNLNPRGLNFGTIFYGQRASLPIRIENCSSVPVQWSIDQIGESPAVVFDAKKSHALGKTVNSNASEENVVKRTSMRTYPSSGDLGPLETTIVVFEFSPQQPKFTYGFKSSQPAVPSQTYHVPMRLLVQSNDSDAEDEPIDILLTGQACELLAHLSKTAFAFSPIHEGGSESLNLTLSNNSNQLGFRFKFPKIAQFSFKPCSGKLDPLQSTSIEIFFKPNQLGNFQETVHCRIMMNKDAALPFVDIESDKDKTGCDVAGLLADSQKDVTISRMPVSMIASCLPKIQTIETLVHVQTLSRSATAAMTDGTAIEPPVQVTSIKTTSTLQEDCGAVVMAAISSGNVVISKFAGPQRVRYVILKKQKLPTSAKVSALPDAEPNAAQVNPEWKKKVVHRNSYIDYIRGSQISRVRARHDRHFHEKGNWIGLDRISISSTELFATDPENGLTPPEPQSIIYKDKFPRHKFKNSAEIPDNMVPKMFHVHAATQLALGGRQKMQALVEKLMAPVVQKSKLASTPLVTNHKEHQQKQHAANALLPPIQAPGVSLSASDLANVYSSIGEMDFGWVTIHSASKLPINFLNVMPSKLPVQISLVAQELGTDRKRQEQPIKILPEQQTISSMAVLGFEVVFVSHTLGKFQGRITYIINERYRYHIQVRAMVVPVTLELSVDRLELEIPSSSFAKLVRHDEDERLSRSRSNTVNIHDWGTHLNGASMYPKVPLPIAEKTVFVINKGNLDAEFELVQTMSRPEGSVDPEAREVHATNGDTDVSVLGERFEGLISVEPKRGRVQANSSFAIVVKYVPGIKTFCESTLLFNAIDSYGGEKNIVGQLKLVCRGEVPPASCLLISPSKQGTLDLGALPVTSLLADMHSNRVGMSTLTPQNWHDIVLASAQTETSKAYSGKSSIRGIRQVKIKNTATSPCLFYVRNTPISAGIDFRPQFGIIAAGEMFELTIMVSPTRIGTFEEVVTVNIIGGNRPFRIPIKFEGREADVRLNMIGDGLSVGAIVSSHGHQNFHLSNHGVVYGRVMIDLREHPEFSICMKDRYEISQSYDIHDDKQQQQNRSRSKASINAFPSLRNIGSAALGTKYAPDARAKTPDGQHAQLCMTTVHGSGGRRNLGMRGVQNDGECYVLDCPPGENIFFDVVFQPLTERRHVLDIPVKFLGMTSAMRKIHIKTEGIASPVVISSKQVVFKNKIVYTAVGASATPIMPASFTENIKLTNIKQESISWDARLVPSVGFEDVFKLNHFSGVIESGKTQELAIVFEPKCAGVFGAAAILSIHHMDMTAEFRISINGNSVEPSLIFDPPEVFLPIVPLGEESMAVFSIINYGCERIEVKPAPTSDTHDLDGIIDFSFPEGKLLKGEGERLTVTVRFVPNVDSTFSNLHSSAGSPALTTSLHQQQQQQKSGTSKKLNASATQQTTTNSTKLNSPVSFTVKVQLGEFANRQFYIAVHGTTDCSPFTLQPFLWMTRNKFSYGLRGARGIYYERNSHLPKMEENLKRIDVLTAPRSFKSASGIPLDGTIPLYLIEGFWLNIGKSILFWLEGHLGGLLNSSKFPSMFIHSNGVMLENLIASLTGKKPNASLTSSVAMSSLDQHVKHLMRFYGDILTHLCASGALLSSVKPEFLLSIEDYRHVTGSRLSDMPAGTQDNVPNYAAQVESHFGIISKEAWATVLLQIVRIYVMPVASVRHFKNLVGALEPEEEELDWYVGRTNAYNTGENVLLKWCAYHFYKRTKIVRRPTNFTVDLSDSVLLANLLLSHVPTLALGYFSGFNSHPSTPEHRFTNAQCLVRAFKAIYDDGVAFNLTPEMICSSDQVGGIMLLMFLYQTLPHFLPTTEIEFEGSLHEKVVHLIELSNPSNKPIQYSAEVSGSPDFSLPEISYTLHPKNTIRIPVEFTSRFCRQVSAFLRLKSRRTLINNSSILTFKLISAVGASTPIKTVRTETPVYSLPPAQVNLEVTNPFLSLGVFTISLRQRKKPDPNTAGDDAQWRHFESTAPPAFRMSQEEVHIGSNCTAVIAVYFLPFEYGLHECTLHFFDGNVGEFSYCIEGKATIPQQIERVVWTCKSMSTMEKALRISPTNSLRDKALYTHIFSNTLQKADASVSGINPNSIENELASGKERRSKELKIHSATAMEREAYQLPKRPLRYLVEYSSPYFHGPSEIMVKPPVSSKDKALVIDQSYTEMTVRFTPKLPGKYMCRVVLNCMETSDLRVYVIQGMALADSSKAELEFTVPARQTICQDIPIVNKTNDDWNIKAVLQGLYFSCPYTVLAKAQTSTNFSVIFRPLTAGEVHGTLTLSNSQTTQKYVYALHGYGQEPLPEDTLAIERVAGDTTRPINTDSLALE